MHQPYYVDPLSRVAMMPWVRMHAVKGYLDMIETARKHPEVHVTFNLTPVLVKQILDFNSGVIKDLWLEWTETLAEDLTHEQKKNILINFFKVNWDNLIAPNPRFHELLVKRGYDIMHINLDAMAGSFTVQDFLDLQVWFNLAWCGFTAFQLYPELRALKEKGRDFTEEDKRVVVGVHRKIMGDILVRYKDLYDKGQIEISTTPFFHPILPLLYDTNFAQRAMPWVKLPKEFSFPTDANGQVEWAIAQHAEVFGRKPKGLWPSEGSVAPELIPGWVELGLEWFATDEEVLFRSLANQSNNGAGRTDLYDVYDAEHGGGKIAAVFRDRSLSDFIGFSASKNPGDKASEFILGHLHGIASATQSHPQPMVGIILDGENAWEHFPDGGESFLNAWYSGLASQNDFKTQTPSEFFAQKPNRKTLTQLHTGSWIHANFDIWIGDEEENQAWEWLGETRRFLESKSNVIDDEKWSLALMEIYAAEGSDWFWWYGPDFSTDNDLIFDQLFRTHLLNVYRICEEPPPEKYYLPICRKTSTGSVIMPIGLVHPKLDGQQTHFFEWREAGIYRVSQGRGTMFQGERIIKQIYFGFDLQHLHLRIDAQTSWKVSKPMELLLSFNGAEEKKLVVKLPIGGLKSAAHWKNGQDTKFDSFSLAKVLEISIPLSDLGWKPKEKVKFGVEVLQDSAQTECHPDSGLIELEVPDASYESATWRV
jgi:alpha-amylase/alpha-mannosidase (GH57 family)